MSDSSSQTVFFKPVRQIGTIIPDCTVEERHDDRLEITHHPVETGANISDHAFMQPFEVSLRYGWSDSSTGIDGGSQQIYDQLQQLQQSRTPFQLITGKRIYQNMLISEMSVETDQHTENALLAEINCTQVIIVSTSEVQTDPANQAMPQQTQGVTSLGPQQLNPISNPPSIPGAF